MMRSRCADSGVFAVAVLSVVLLPVVAWLATQVEDATPKPQGLVSQVAEPTGEPKSADTIYGDYPLVNTALYDVVIDRDCHIPTRITYTVDGKDLATPAQERNGSFWSDGFGQDVLDEADYDGNGEYDIGHLRAWRLSASHLHWKMCNWMGATAPMHQTLNRGVFRKWEDHVFKLVQAHGRVHVDIDVGDPMQSTGKALPNADESYAIPKDFTCTVLCAGERKTWRFPNDASVKGKSLEEFEVKE